MKIIGKSLKELAALCTRGEHYQLYLELKALHPEIEFPDEIEDEEEDNGVRMAMVEHMGINWMLFAKAGRIIDSDMDNL